MSRKGTPAAARDGRRRRGRPPALERHPTGIRGLDGTLLGGLPRGRVTLVSGGAGAGKSVLGQEFLYRGVTVHGEPGVCVTLEEPVGHIVRNVASFGWDYEPLVRRGALAFVDAGARALPLPIEIDARYDLTPLLERIRATVARVGARRVVLDSLSPLFERLGAGRAVRTFADELCRSLEAMEVTTLLLIEASTSGSDALTERTAQFVADGAIELDVEVGQQRMSRRLVVRKLRGAAYQSAPSTFDIDAGGLVVYPKLVLDGASRRKVDRGRASSGVPGLDAKLGGGIPRGHSVLVSGNTGTGKSAFCRQFLSAGLAAGEGAVFVALEEPAAQVRRAAAAQGMKLTGHERAGRLRIVEAPLIDLYPDKVLLDEIVAAIEATDARRFVFDSFSSLESATMDADEVRQFLFQLAAYLKHRAVTALTTYLVPAAFGAEKGQLLGGLETTELRLSSVVDGILLLRYVERDQQVKRLVNVLKLRNSAHAHDIFTFEVGRRGASIGERFEA